MAAKLALVGSWALCSAADRPGAATITWPVPSVVAMDEGAWVTMVWVGTPALLSALDDSMEAGDGLRAEGELVAVVTMGAAEMTDAVFVPGTGERDQ